MDFWKVSQEEEENNIIKKTNKSSLSLERLLKCVNCPLYKKERSGGKCSSNLYAHPETNEVSFSRKPGFIKGCGCSLNNKLQQRNAKCPLNKW